MKECRWNGKPDGEQTGYCRQHWRCAPQQGTCKLTLNVKEGIIQEALVETIGCSGMTHSAAMASEILPGRTVLEGTEYRPCL